MRVITLKYDILFISVTAVLLLAPSCVSKKKFVAMTEQRNVAEKKATVCGEENEILRRDFENYRIESANELLQKQTMIDSLKRTVITLNSDFTSKKDNIEDQIFSFQLETAKLSQLINEKDKEIRNLTRGINTLKIQVDDLTRELEEAKSGFKFPFGNVKQLERKIQTKEKEIAFLDSCLNSTREEIIELKLHVTPTIIRIDTLNSLEDSSIHILDKQK
jgi:chromosome segregation ATPase